VVGQACIHCVVEIGFGLAVADKKDADRFGWHEAGTWVLR
jgi:hypothetical protein